MGRETSQAGGGNREERDACIGRSSRLSKKIYVQISVASWAVIIQNVTRYTMREMMYNKRIRYVGDKVMYAIEGYENEKGSDVENDFRNCRPIEGRGGARDEVKNEELKIKLN